MIPPAEDQTKLCNVAHYSVLFKAAAPTAAMEVDILFLLFFL